MKQSAIKVTRDRRKRRRLLIDKQSQSSVEPQTPKSNFTPTRTSFADLITRSLYVVSVTSTMPLNDDIIREIVQHLSLAPERPEDFRTFIFNNNSELEELHRRTLASAALTCKAFSEPASEALWAVLPDGLLPLLHTFSSLRITYKTSYMGSRKHVQAMYYTLDSGAIQSTEMQRFEHLAARVRFACCTTQTTPEIDPSVLTAMLEQFSPLFPNLRALEWRESSGLDPHLSRLLRSLVSTSSLSAFFYRPASNSTADMSLLTSLRPDLPHLRVWDIRHMLCGTTALIPLRSLVSVHILDVDPSFFCHLATLTHLEDVAVSLARESSGSGQRKPLPGVPGFRSLKRFATLGSIPAEDIVWMLSVIATTSTRLSTLDVGVRTSFQELLPALEKIGSMPVLRNLRTLKLRLHLNTGYRACLQLPLSNIASPFYPIPSLEDVSFAIRNRIIDLSEQDLTRMQEAWPNLIKTCRGL
ncbi:hypothetical protein C8Q74DRAFT_1441341 [Fomes fomentarius]|nr:hypothetical protein C8Q74DRAFT_1441341 [Fomes fomentarius]